MQLETEGEDMLKSKFQSNLSTYLNVPFAVDLFRLFFGTPLHPDGSLRVGWIDEVLQEWFREVIEVPVSQTSY